MAEFGYLVLTIQSRQKHVLFEKIRFEKMQQKYFVLIIIVCQLFTEATAVVVTATVVAVAGKTVVPAATRVVNAAASEMKTSLLKDEPVNVAAKKATQG